MSEPIKILGLGGSLRPRSRTENALQIALSGAEEAGAEIEIFNLRDTALPLYDVRDDIDSYAPNVHKLIEMTRNADGLLLATPVYHGILSGAMKNALDFIEIMADDPNRWLTGKAVGLISVAGGGQGTNSNNSLLYACQTLKAVVCPTMAALSGRAFNNDFELEDQALIDRLKLIGRDVTRLAGQLHR